jgi:hypothetical protein
MLSSFLQLLTVAVFWCGAGIALASQASTCSNRGACSTLLLPIVGKLTFKVELEGLDFEFHLRIKNTIQHSLFKDLNIFSLANFV